MCACIMCTCVHSVCAGVLVCACVCACKFGGERETNQTKLYTLCDN